MQKNKIDNDFENLIVKGYEDAKFYLDILIDNKIINRSDNRIKHLFMDWFSKNKKIDQQSENIKLASELTDSEKITDFNKHDIIDFINWYNNEKSNFVSFLNENGISAQKQNKISEQNINAENVIINNGKIETIKQKTILNGKAKLSIWAIIGVIIPFLVFLFGNNIMERIKTHSLIRHTHESELIDYFYFGSEAHPIIDDQLYIRASRFFFELGGVSFDQIKKIGIRSVNGEKIDITEGLGGGYLIFDINKLPYIEFLYKDKFYSLEIKFQHYSQSYRASLEKIDTPTLNMIELN